MAADRLLLDTGEFKMIKGFKIGVEKHSGDYVAYPFGLKGVVVGEGNTYEAVAKIDKRVDQWFNHMRRQLQNR